jgi:hypothetical protein
MIRLAFVHLDPPRSRIARDLLFCFPSHTACIMSAEHPQQLQTAGTAAGKSSNSSANSSDFGSDIPYGDPYWYRTFKSPYYTDAHRQFRAKVRAFVDEHVTPFCHEVSSKHARKVKIYGWRIMRK